MPTPRSATARSFSVALDGFSPVEREALSAYFLRFVDHHTPSYALMLAPAQSDLIVADADQASVVQRILAARRIGDTVFVGATAPPHALAHVARPIEPVLIQRGLDRIVAQRTVRVGLDLELPLAGAGIAPPQVDVLLHDIVLPEAGAGDRRLRPGHGGGRTALVVDDSPIARKFLSVRLQRLGYTVQAAASGEQALELAARELFAIVFLDVGPGAGAALDGLQVCRRIRQMADERGLAAPAIVLVADGDASPSERVRGSLAGCDGYLTKPLLEPEFIEVLGTVDPEFRHQAVAATAASASASASATG